MSEYFPNEISQSVLEAILYSDVFDFPLTAHEVHRYLPETAASREEVFQILNMDSRFVKIGNYYTLIGREKIAGIREQRQLHSNKLMAYAWIYGRVIGTLPFIRMVAVTGSLAVRNVSKNADFDYMLVTKPGRLWTARAFVLLLNRITRLFGHTICPNLIVSENCLEWHPRDLYSAHEFCQMIPITGRDMYYKLMSVNPWIKGFLPNAYLEFNSSRLENVQEPAPALQKVLEFPLRGKLGDRIEQWEMNRKIARFSKHVGFGEETIFNSDMCQGNFEHYRQRTEEQLEQRIRKFQDAGIRVRDV